MYFCSFNNRFVHGRKLVLIIYSKLSDCFVISRTPVAAAVRMTSSDTLMPREAGKFIAEHSKNVTICTEGINQLANKMLDILKSNPVALDVERWSTHELNPKTCDAASIDWVFVSDVLNFSFWSENDSNKYKIRYNNKDWTGYWSLCAAMNRAIDEGVPICDPAYYSTMSMDQLKHVFRSDSDVPMPLLEQRLQNLHEAGKVLTQKYGGTFVNVIKAADRSAQNLLRLVLENFPSFRDEAQYNGKTVGIYKRVQILIGDIWASCGGRGYGEFLDIDTITMFADYRIPQALVWFGALKYSDTLMARLNGGEMFESGDPDEVEIRGCSIWAIELAVEALRSRIAKDDGISSDTHINAIILDHYLWDYRREHAKATSDVPMHKIRCIYY